MISAPPVLGHIPALPGFDPSGNCRQQVCRVSLGPPILQCGDRTPTECHLRSSAASVDMQSWSGSMDQEHDAGGGRIPPCIVYEPSVSGKEKPCFWEDHAVSASDLLLMSDKKTARDERKASIDEASDDTVESTAAGSISPAEPAEPADMEHFTADSSPLSHRSTFEHAWCLVNQRKHEEEMARLQQQLNKRMEECIRLRQQSIQGLWQSCHSPRRKPPHTLGLPYSGSDSSFKCGDGLNSTEGPDKEVELLSLSRFCGINEAPFAWDFHGHAASGSAPGASGASSACIASSTGDSSLFTDHGSQATDAAFEPQTGTTRLGDTSDAVFKKVASEIDLGGSHEALTPHTRPFPDECGQDHHPSQVLRLVSAPYRMDMTPRQQRLACYPFGMRSNHDIQQQQQQQQQQHHHHHQQHHCRNQSPALSPPRQDNHGLDQSPAMSPPRSTKPFPGRSLSRGGCQSVAAKSHAAAASSPYRSGRQETLRSPSVACSRNMTEAALCPRPPAQRPEFQQPHSPRVAPHTVRLGQHPQALLQMLPMPAGPGMQQPRR